MHLREMECLHRTLGCRWLHLPVSWLPAIGGKVSLLMIESFRKVLFIGAHPDDESACAGTMQRLRDSDARIDVLTFSSCADQIPYGFTSRDLFVEWRDAMEMFAVHRRNMLTFPNQHFTEHRQEILQELVDRRNDGYDLVLLPSTSDIHQDHSVVREEGVRAFKHTTILGYEQPQNVVRATNLAAYVALLPIHVEVKVAHAQTYKSQAHRTYMREDLIRGVAAMRGVQANVEYAEAFEVIRWML